MSNPRKTEHPAGAGKKAGLRMAFDRRLKLEFHGSQVTSDAGLLACRELDEALSLTAPAAELLHDWRTGGNKQP
ncbi:MAG TPA: IS1380 family transposase, partial [Verrucomicrobiae bacterium]|nr:IS1380 family transposase [Verrucomicrobiae bacterium]